MIAFLIIDCRPKVIGVEKARSGMLPDPRTRWTLCNGGAASTALSLELDKIRYIQSALRLLLLDHFTWNPASTINK